MLKALGKSGAPVLAWKAQRGDRFTCPECLEPVVLKHGRIVAAHFAHRPDSGCSFGVGESERHMAMKQAMGAVFSHFCRGQVEYEVPLVSGRRADVIVQPSQHAPLGGCEPLGWIFVVECQASSIAVPEWHERTVDYANAGYPVLWVWDTARLGLHEGFRFKAGEQDWTYEQRIPVEIRHCYEAARGLVYALDVDGIIRSTTLHQPEERYHERQGWYVPETKRRLSFKPTWLDPSPYRGENGEGLVHLDGAPDWWRPNDDPTMRPLWSPRTVTADEAEVWWKPGR